MQEELSFFTSVRTSKGVYRPLPFAVDDFLEMGENLVVPAAPLSSANSFSAEEEVSVTVSKGNKLLLCERSKDLDFAEKLKEGLGFLQSGLPVNTVMNVGISYAINLIKQEEGKELLWFQAISFDGSVLQVKLMTAPEKVKYLKQGSVIKPALEKIESFQFEETI